MKNINYLFLAITLIVSCDSKTKSSTNDFFNPDIEISVNDLKSDGYYFVDDWSMYNKVQNDTAFMYQSFYDQDPVFIRTIHIDNWEFQDSLDISNWIELHGGLIVSHIDHNPNTIDFFVQGKKSGLYSKCSILKEHFYITFYYPDTRRFNRSQYRTERPGDLITEFEYEGAKIRIGGEGILNIETFDRKIK